MDRNIKFRVWDSNFKTLEVKVKSKVNITGSSETNSPVKVGD